jgi:hypothetical protein
VAYVSANSASFCSPNRSEEILHTFLDLLDRVAKQLTRFEETFRVTGYVVLALRDMLSYPDYVFATKFFASIYKPLEILFRPIREPTLSQFG